MIVERWEQKERESVIWNWDCVRDFPGILCKQLLWPDGDYYAGWATIKTPEEYLSLQLRDQGPSKCLTPSGGSHGLGDVLRRMDESNWTFERLAANDLSQGEAPRKQSWFDSCVKLEAKFAIEHLGLLAIHPRSGLKEQARKGDVYDASQHEVYEGLHRALILAKKLREGSLKWQPLKLIYLYPDRET